MKFILSSLLIFISIISFGQSLASEIDGIYNFVPSKLTSQEQQTKMEPLDKFWEKVKSDTTQYLPLLRDALTANGHNPFFYYDGSSLLLSLTDDKADKALAIEAIAKCDLNDISRQVYVMTLNKLANEEMDVTKPALKILAADSFSFFIVQHALIFTQGYCLTYMLLPQQNLNYVDSLITIFKTVSPAAQESIIFTLWHAYSCKGDIFLQSLLADKTLNKKVAKRVKEATMEPKPSKADLESMKSMDKQQLYELRASSLIRFSDEGVDDLNTSIRALRLLKACK